MPIQCCLPKADCLLRQDLKLTYDTIPDDKPGAPTKRDDDSSHLIKRQGSRTINNCPGDGTNVPPQWNRFIESHCGPANRLTSYTITCNRRGARMNDGNMVSSGSCRPGEICMDRAVGNLQQSTAFCVSGDNIVKLLRATMANAQRQVDITFTSPISDSSLNEEVVLTGDDNNGDMFMATSIEMDAVDANGKTLGTPQKCQNCDRLVFSPWPVGIAGFLVTVVLPHVNDVAILHAANFK